MARPNPVEPPPSGFTLEVNGVRYALAPEAVVPDMPLLWVLRDVLQLTQTKYGCDDGRCGACTVWVDGQAARACQWPVSALGRRAVHTLEGAGGQPVLMALQRAWAQHQVSQCGYCDSGVIMSAGALLLRTPSPTVAEIDAAITQACPCGATPRFRAAIQSVAQAGRDKPTQAPRR